MKEEYEIIFYNLCNAKHKIVVENPMSYERFQEIIDLIVQSNDSLLLKAIDEFVETNYSLDLDGLTALSKSKSKKVNEELQFKDEHGKVILKIAYLFRFMIPVIALYFLYNKNNYAKTTNELSLIEDDEDVVEELVFEEVNAAIFAYLFEKFAKNAEALRTKIYKLTYSRVAKTSYSDMRFWAIAKTQGITQETVALDIYKRVLTNAIPKLIIDENKNIISFFQSVINNQIDFLFQNKFKYRYISLGSPTEKYIDNGDDENGTQFERFELQNLRRDEGLYMIRKLSIESTLKKLPKIFGVEVTKEEIQTEVKRRNRHVNQERIVTMLTLKHFDDKDAIKFLNFYQYTYLVLLCKKYLEQQKFVLLPLILTARCRKHKERVKLSGPVIQQRIRESKDYQELFATKYSHFLEEVKLPLDKLIAEVYVAVITDDEGNNLLKNSTIKVPAFASELLDLTFLV